jgi:hypothetical protein
VKIIIDVPDLTLEDLATLRDSAMAEPRTHMHKAELVWLVPREGPLGSLCNARRVLAAEEVPSPKTGYQPAAPIQTRPLTDAERYETCPRCGELPGHLCTHMTSWPARTARPHRERVAKRRAVLKVAGRG